MKSKTSAPVKAKRSATSQPPAKQQSKQSQIIELLKKKTGTSIEEMMVLTGWQAHYADVLVMPTNVGNLACVAEIAALGSA